MNGQRKSDSPIVPGKPPNKTIPDQRSSDGEAYTGTKAETPDTDKAEPVAGLQDEKVAAEVVEERGLAKGNVDQQNVHRTQRRARTPSALDRVREVARKDRNAKFTALFHHITVDALRRAFFSLRRGAAAGIDGVTWQHYERDGEGNLAALHDRLRRGAYRAKPSRRVFIPKADGRLRPLGIAALEDKIVQLALVEVLNSIYEQDFLGFSYGFRPGRSQHDALDALYVGLTRRKVNWVLDADIRGFFDAIDHECMMRFLEHRISDRRVLRLVLKWLRSGVVDGGGREATSKGTPQGATISPLLANVYLHYVVDLWVEHWRRYHAQGDIIVTRYADDFVVGFQYRADATRFQRDLQERLRQFSLELHPDKTRLIQFGRFAARDCAASLRGKPETFNFLGFTHMCSSTRDGRFVVARRTMRKRLRTKLHEVRDELRRRMHLPIPEQGRWLGAVVRGYLSYHSVPLNTWAMEAFRKQVILHWHRTLRRRSQRDSITWRRMARLVRRWLPSVQVIHPWPSKRFDVRTQGRSPVR